MKIQFLKTVNAIQIIDYMGRLRSGSEFDADKECQHLNFTLCKNYVKITTKKNNDLLAVVPLVNVAYFRPYLDIISESKGIQPDSE